MKIMENRLAGAGSASRPLMGSLARSIYWVLLPGRKLLADLWGLMPGHRLLAALWVSMPGHRFTVSAGPPGCVLWTLGVWPCWTPGGLCTGPRACPLDPWRLSRCPPVWLLAALWA